MEQTAGSFLGGGGGSENNGGFCDRNNNLSGLTVPVSGMQSTGFGFPAQFSRQPNSFLASLSGEDNNHGGPSKRIRTSEPSDQAMESLVFQVQDQRSSPLGLTLHKSNSFLNLLQTRVSTDRKRSFSEMNKKSDQPNQSRYPQGSEKLKAANFPIMLLRIGSWENESLYEGHLVAKCYYSKRKLVWEILDGSLKSKIEIPWSDIAAMRAICSENQPGILELELSNRPQYFGETNPQPRKHTIWQKTSDFTGGQASIHRRHYLQFAPGVLEKQYSKLAQCDIRLKILSQSPFPIMEDPFFPTETNDEPEFNYGNGLETSPRALMPSPMNPTPILPAAQPLQVFKSSEVQPQNMDSFSTNPTSLSLAQPLQAVKPTYVQPHSTLYSNSTNLISLPSSPPSNSTNPTSSPSLSLVQPLHSFKPTHVQPHNILDSTPTNPSLPSAPPLQAFQRTYVQFLNFLSSASPQTLLEFQATHVQPLNILNSTSTNPTIFPSLPPSQVLQSFKSTHVQPSNTLDSASPMSVMDFSPLDETSNNQRAEFWGPGVNMVSDHTNGLMGSGQVPQVPYIGPAIQANPSMNPNLAFQDFQIENANSESKNLGLDQPRGGMATDVQEHLQDQQVRSPMADGLQNLEFEEEMSPIGVFALPNVVQLEEFQEDIFGDQFPQFDLPNQDLVLNDHDIVPAHNLPINQLPELRQEQGSPQGPAIATENEQLNFHSNQWIPQPQISVPSLENQMMQAPPQVPSPFPQHISGRFWQP